MKKISLGTLVVGLVFSVDAHCQSSVTLYGLVDAGVGYISNQGGASAFQMATRSASFYGFRGTEDLGGGYRAIFWLESGFSTANGSIANGGTLFGRQAQVGLSAPWGQITMGNQYDAVVDELQVFSSSGTFAGNLGAESGDVNNIWADFHVNNSVKFSSATFHGLSAEAMYGFGGVAGSMSTKSIYSAGAAYRSGQLAIGVAYLNINNPITAVYQGTTAPANTQTLGTPFSSPIYTGYASARTLQIAGMGASYAIGTITVNALYSNTEFRSITPTPGGNQRLNAHFNNFELNQTFLATPSVALSLGGIYTSATGANYEQVVGGVNYLLSKRTGLYILGAWVRANGIDSRGRPAVADIANAVASTTRNQIAIRTGIRMRF
ncbi:porin [Paraburkholderia xenovorans]|uniref:porin n=1 Tax=Paraburkholderia xenovorans TaxID=36873 RepID=UPI0038B70B7B